MSSQVVSPVTLQTFPLLDSESLPDCAQDFISNALLFVNSLTRKERPWV